MNIFEWLKVILIGIVEGITEWLPISSTGHMILVETFLPFKATDVFTTDFMDMFNVVIQLGAILAVVTIYFNKLNPWAKGKSQAKRRATIELWKKVIIGCIPAGVIGVLFNDWLEEKMYNSYVIAATLILYGIAFIVVETLHKGKEGRIQRFSQLDYKTVIMIGLFQVLSLIPGTSRSGATIIGALIIGVSREVAAEFTFFLAIPAMFGASLLKLIKFGFHFTGAEFGLLMLGCVVSFGLSVVAIKFLMGYIKKHDFKVFGYYRIVLGGLIVIVTLIKMLFA